MTGFYDLDSLSAVAVNLFHGYGYNFYRAENQLRADDQLVRGIASTLLGQARTTVEGAEADYRRRKLAPPTRANPFPEPSAVTGAQALERLSRDVGALEARIRHQPVPANDRMTQLYRNEAAVLAQLAEHDKRLVGHAELLRAALAGLDGETMLASDAALRARLNDIATLLRERQLLIA